MDGLDVAAVTRPGRRALRAAARVGLVAVLAVLVWLGSLWRREHSFTLPPPPDDSAGMRGWELRCAAAKAAVEKNDKPTASELQALVKLNAVALAKLDQALKAPCWVPPFPEGDQTEYFQALANLRSLARVLVQVSSARAAAGDLPGAVDACLDGLQLASDVQRTRDLAVAGVGVSMAEPPLSALSQLAPRLDAETARAAARRLSAVLATRPTAAQALRWHAPLMAHRAAAPLTWPRNKLWATLNQGDRNMHRVLGTPRMGWRESAALYLTSRRVQMRDWGILISAPEPRVRYAETLAWCEATASELDRPFAAIDMPVPPEWICTDVGFNAWQSGVGASHALVARGRLALVHLAARVYQTEHGVPPNSLQELVPAHLPSLPIDPFDGQTLRYRRAGQTWLCYALGPDLKDDGGRPLEKVEYGPPGERPKPKPFDQRKGDIVCP